jgi:hypothetical protein
MAPKERRLSLRVCKTISLIMLASLAFCQCGRATRRSGAADGPAAKAAAAAADAARQFPAAVEQALLFDPRMGPLNASLSDEPGPHLLAIGSVRNDTGRVLHRAKIYATLAAAFGERTVIERHSGGLGFSPPVNSDDPWRPGTERSFACITRPLDPIYLELFPEKVTGALTLTAQDPLSFRFRGEIARFAVEWKTVFGVARDRRAIVVGDADGVGAVPKECRLPREHPLRLLYQRGAAFKAVDEAGRFCWLKYDQFAYDAPAAAPAVADPPARLPFAVRLDDGLTVRVTRVAGPAAHVEGAAAGQAWSVALQYVNEGPKPVRTPAPNQFALDLSAGAYAAALKSDPDKNPVARSLEIAPGKTVDGSLTFFYVPADADDKLQPFDLELRLPKQKPIRFPLSGL